MSEQSRHKFLIISFLTGTAFLSMLTTPSLSNTPKMLKSIELLLPSNTEISPWSKDGPANIYKENRLFEYINGGAEIFFEYGFSQLITQEYIYDDELLVVDIYEMNDAAAAFGIYSINRDYKLPALNIGGDGTQFEYHVAFWQNLYFVVIRGYKSDKAATMILSQFANNISKQIGKTSEQPQLLTYLPKNCLLPRSQGYLRGILGLNSQLYLTQNNILEIGDAQVEGAFATYHDNNDEAHLLLIHYDNSKIAREKKDLILDILSNKYEKQTHNGSSIYKDNKGRYYSANAINDFLCIVFKSSSYGMISEMMRQEAYPITK